MGSLYYYHTNSYTATGNGIFKIGMSTSINANKRIDSELNETLSQGREAIFNANNNDIKYIVFDRTSENIKNLESLLHAKLDCQRINNKELFYGITEEDIRNHMREMIDEYGGYFTSYNDSQINYFDGEHDDWRIEERTCNKDHLKNRGNQFIGKTIGEIRSGNSIRLHTYKHGSSKEKDTFCNFSDFKYIIGKSIVINP
jgi:hypothetical protein|tara:strand:- start:1691 stop:2290 length:600 start_codon:yes stop_codon:yes gene_type:complete